MSLRWNSWLCAVFALVALVYAVLPDGPLRARDSGSAFSASTSDVAITCAVGPEIERRALPDRPAPPPPPRCAASVVALVPGAIPASLQESHRTPKPPVSLRTILTPLSPRAPPAA